MLFLVEVFQSLLWAVLVAVGVLVASWVLLVVLARRLPPALLRDVAAFLPVIGPLDDVVAVVLLLRFAARAMPRRVLLEALAGGPEAARAGLGRTRRAHRWDKGLPRNRERCRAQVLRDELAGSRSGAATGDRLAARRLLRPFGRGQR